MSAVVAQEGEVVAKRGGSVVGGLILALVKYHVCMSCTLLSFCAMGSKGGSGANLFYRCFGGEKFGAFAPLTL